MEDEDVVDARRLGDNLANSPKGNLAGDMIEAFSFFFFHQWSGTIFIDREYISYTYLYKTFNIIEKKQPTAFHCYVNDETFKTHFGLKCEQVFENCLPT